MPAGGIGGPGAVGRSWRVSAGRLRCPGLVAFPTRMRSDLACSLPPVFMNQGDTNKDQRLSSDELLAVGRQWFDAWDVQNADALNVEQIRDGLNETMAPPAGLVRRAAWVRRGQEDGKCRTEDELSRARRQTQWGRGGDGHGFSIRACGSRL